LKVSIRKA